MKKLFLLLLLLPSVLVKAQNLDSLFNEFARIKGLYREPTQTQSVQETKPIKCTFGTIAEVRANYNKFSPKQRLMIVTALQRQSTDTSIVSPNQKFRIHYNKKGSYVPTYDVNVLAIAADSVYNYEINILGYTPPPSDGTAGGDDKYDIYIQNEGSNYYGGTTPEELVGDSTWTSFMEINYDFNGNFQTTGVNAAIVTVAHEFHHAIQVGSYIYRPSDLFYYELTSTSMEEFVFDNINDYYGYLDEYFENTSLSFGSIEGYGLAIWNLYLADRLDGSAVADSLRGKNIIRRTWKLMARHERALPAIAAAIQEAGSTFEFEFKNFGVWTYFTGSRAVAGKYFDEAANYPTVSPFMTLPYLRSVTSFTCSSEAVSNLFLVFTEGAGDTKNVMVSIVSNHNIAGALNYPCTTTNFIYTLEPQSFSGSELIVDGYNYQVKPATSSDSDVFMVANIYNGVPIEESVKQADFVYPQPFRYSVNPVINIPATATGTGVGDLYVYDMGMKLVYSAQTKIVASKKVVMQWNGLDSSGKKLGTGVYLYVTKCGDNINKGKLVIYND